MPSAPDRWRRRRSRASRVRRSLNNLRPCHCRRQAGGLHRDRPAFGAPVIGTSLPARLQQEKIMKRILSTWGVLVASLLALPLALAEKKAASLDTAKIEEVT